MTIATELPKGLTTEKQIIEAAFELMEKQLGLAAAAYHFCYDKDYPSDVVNEYIWLNKQESLL